MTADVWTDRPVKAGEHNRNGLERIFDSFLQTLEHRGCPQDILTMARVQKTEAIRFACMTPVGEKHVPFIGPVIRPPYLDYHQLMTLCRNGDRDEDGYTSFESADISDA